MCPYSWVQFQRGVPAWGGAAQGHLFGGKVTQCCGRRWPLVLIHSASLILRVFWPAHRSCLLSGLRWGQGAPLDPGRWPGLFLCLHAFLHLGVPRAPRSLAWKILVTSDPPLVVLLGSLGTAACLFSWS